MGKVGNLLLIGAAVAVNVFPGVGQFASGLITGALGGSFTAYGVAVTALQAVTLGGIMAGIGTLGSVFAPTSASGTQSSERQVRNPRAVRVYIDGTRRAQASLVQV